MKMRSARLLKGDMLNILPLFDDNVFDALITDPPYSSGGSTAYQKRRTTGEKYQDSDAQKIYPNFLGDQKDQRSWTNWMYQWLAEAKRVVKPGGVIAMFY